MFSPSGGIYDEAARRAYLSVRRAGLCVLDGMRFSLAGASADAGRRRGHQRGEPVGWLMGLRRQQKPQTRRRRLRYLAGANDAGSGSV